jgi:hypothetical protein
VAGRALLILANREMGGGGGGGMEIISINVINHGFLTYLILVARSTRNIQ